ncbi:MAG: acyltransferase [Bacteroidota bacterium]
MHSLRPAMTASVSPPVRPRLESIQVLRGLAALLVVLLHLSVAERKYGDPEQLLLPLLTIGNAGVDLFFVISGFVMVVSTRGRWGQAAQVVPFWTRRALRIYPVYWVYLALVALVCVVQPGWVNAASGAPPGPWASILLWPTGQVHLVMVAWTLEYELFFYLLFGALMVVPPRYFAAVLLAVLGGLVVLGAAWGPTAPALRVATSALLLEFGAGVVLGLAYVRGPPPEGRAWLGPLAAGTGAALLLVQALGLEWPALLGLGGTDFDRPVGYGGPAALLVYGFVRGEQQTRRSWPRLLTRLGDASYTLYLSHILVLAAVGRLWRLAGLDAWVPPVVLVGVLLSACVVFAWVAYVWVEAPLMRWLAPLGRAKRTPSAPPTPP